VKREKESSRELSSPRYSRSFNTRVYTSLHHPGIHLSSPPGYTHHASHVHPGYIPPCLPCTPWVYTPPRVHLPICLPCTPPRVHLPICLPPWYTRVYMPPYHRGIPGCICLPTREEYPGYKALGSLFGRERERLKTVLASLGEKERD